MSGRLRRGSRLLPILVAGLLGTPAEAALIPEDGSTRAAAGAEAGSRPEPWAGSAPDASQTTGAARATSSRPAMPRLAYSVLTRR